jgi:hypothetical protein
LLPPPTLSIFPDFEKLFPRPNAIIRNITTPYMYTPLVELGAWYTMGTKLRKTGGGVGDDGNGMGVE